MIKKASIAGLTLSMVASFGIMIVAGNDLPEVAGTIFGEPVPRGNYTFVLRVVLSFSSPWGSIPRDRQQLEKRIWDELLLSYEAHRRNITVTQSEVDEKITETLKGERVSFDWKNESDAYERWVKDHLNEPVEAFSNQMRHLVQIKKLHEQVLHSSEPVVTEDEAFQEFLNEQNNLSVELAEFEDQEQAKEFYAKVIQRPEYWEEAVSNDRKKPHEDRSFRTPGFVTLEFLMDMWKFPKEAVYAMIESGPGSFHPPTPIYKGYGVFKVLEVRRADEAKFDDRRDYYFAQLKSLKKYQGFQDWLSRLRKNAAIQTYTEAPAGIFP